MNCWLWHQWGSWHRYVEEGVSYPSVIESIMRKQATIEAIPYSELRQRRECTRCGFTQDKKVAKGG